MKTLWPYLRLCKSLHVWNLTMNYRIRVQKNWCCFGDSIRLMAVIIEVDSDIHLSIHPSIHCGLGCVRNRLSSLEVLLSSHILHLLAPPEAFPGQMGYFIPQMCCGSSPDHLPAGPARKTSREVSWGQQHQMIEPPRLPPFEHSHILFWALPVHLSVFESVACFGPLVSSRSSSHSKATLRVVMLERRSMSGKVRVSPWDSASPSVMPASLCTSLQSVCGSHVLPSDQDTEILDLPTQKGEIHHFTAKLPRLQSNEARRNTSSGKRRDAKHPVLPSWCIVL